MEKAVDKATSWFRRIRHGGLTHEHQELPTDDRDEDEGGEFGPPTPLEQPPPTPWWQRFLQKLEDLAPTPRQQAGYESTLQEETDGEVQQDEEAQLRRAIQASLQESGDAHGGEGTGHPDPVAEDHDFAVALALQEEEEAARAAAPSGGGPGGRPRQEQRDAPSPPAAQPDLISLESPRAAAAAAERAAAEEQLKADEMLARALQEEEGDPTAAPPGSGSGAWGPPHGPGGAAGPAAAQYPSAPPVGAERYGFFSGGSGGGTRTGLCGGCGGPIGFGQFFTCMGATWHPGCFRCKACGSPIVEREFKAKDNEPYHSQCYRTLFHPKCSVCDQYIPSNRDGLIMYSLRPFWGDKYCPVHESDGTARCTACQRLEPASTPYVDLADGRKLCLACVETAVVDTHECTPLFLEVMGFYERRGMRISQEIPLLCVETQALNAAREGERQGHHLAETRGLCLSEEQTIQTVVRLPGFNRYVGGSGRLGGIGQQQQTLQRHCEVTAVLVLYGLPQLLTGSILAHELMHAYMKLDGHFPHLPPHVEEGICQVMSYLWLQSQVPQQEDPASRAQGGGPAAGGGGNDRSYRERFAEFCMHQISTDSSPVYGEGFRAGYAAVQRIGLAATLEHIKLTGDFP